MQCSSLCLRIDVDELESNYIAKNVGEVDNYKIQLCEPQFRFVRTLTSPYALWDSAERGFVQDEYGAVLFGSKLEAAETASKLKRAEEERDR